MKIIGLVLLALAALIAAALFWLRGNVDALVKDAIASQGSAMTQARVSVGAVELRAGDGTGFVRELSIGNPAGFKTPHAIKVGEIEVSIDLASLTRDVVLIRRIVIKAPDIIYEKGESMTNFDAIQKNIAAYVGAAQKKGDGGGGGKKLIIEEFTVRDARVQASAAFMLGKTASLTLPDITLRKLGQARGGMAPGEMGQEIAQALRHRLASAISFDGLAKSATQTLEGVGNAVKGLFGK